MASKPRRGPWFAFVLGCTPGFRSSARERYLKLTMSRIRLLSHKRQVQVKQLELDIAQLLLRGKRADAEARLVRFWREACILSVYVTVGEYCKFVKENLHNVDDWQSSRECPMDMREAMESLYFAASHCSDLPELKEFRGMMTEKLSKDFYTGSHVNKQFHQAFYDSTPSEDRKNALLMEICTEYNIKDQRQVGETLPGSHPSQCYLSLREGAHHDGPGAKEKHTKRIQRRQGETGMDGDTEFPILVASQDPKWKSRNGAVSKEQPLREAYGGDGTGTDPDALTTNESSGNRPRSRVHLNLNRSGQQRMDISGMRRSEKLPEEKWEGVDTYGKVKWKMSTENAATRMKSDGSDSKVGEGDYDDQRWRFSKPPERRPPAIPSRSKQQKDGEFEGEHAAESAASSSEEKETSNRRRGVKERQQHAHPSFPPEYEDVVARLRALKGEA